MNQHVGAVGQCVQRTYPVGRLQVEYDGTFPAVEFVERQRVVVQKRLAHTPSVVATVRLFDFDDGRAEIRQNRARIRAASTCPISMTFRSSSISRFLGTVVRHGDAGFALDH